MSLHLKHLFAIIFFIFFLCPSSKAQRSYSHAEDVPLKAGEQVLPMPWGGGLNAPLLQTADLTGDGLEELIALDRSSQSMLVFAWEGQEWKARQELVCLLPSDIRNWFLMEDNDGDGKKDIFTFTSAGIRVFRNISAAGEPASWELVAPVVNYQSNDRAVNLLVNSGDVPAIKDVDGDGDLDILTYDPSGGGGLQFYKNISVESGQEPGQLIFVRESRRWGGLSECNCGEFAFEGEACESKEGHRLLHAGGKSLLLVDVDDDGDLDLLNGFEECQALYYLENKGTNEVPFFNEFATQLPGSKKEVDMAFPAAFSVDVEQQGRNDILVSTMLSGNSSLQNDFSQTLWWFKSSGQAGSKAYHLQTTAFLQEDMLDAGTSAIPAFLDVDADGDLDMLLGNYGTARGDGFGASLRLIENTGSAEAPAFELSEQDFLQLGEEKLVHLFPQVLDVNGDGRQDIILLATESESFKRKAFIYLNGAGSNAPAVFTAEGEWELPARLGGQDNPFFFDVNTDGLPDLIVGRFDGSLSYFENKGTARVPDFDQEVRSFLGLGLDNYRRPLVPSVSDLSGNGQADLLLADGTGSIRYLMDFRSDMQEQRKSEEVLLCQGLESQQGWFGRKSWPLAVPLRRGKAPVLAVGNLLGGIWLLETDESPAVPDGDSFLLKVFPNPAARFREQFHIRSNMQARIRVISITGQLLKAFDVKAHVKLPVSLAGMNAGIYLIQAQSKAGNYATKLIVLE